MTRRKHAVERPTPPKRAWSQVPTPIELQEPAPIDVKWLRFSLEQDAAYIAGLILQGHSKLADVHIAQTNYRYRLNLLHELEAESAS